MLCFGKNIQNERYYPIQIYQMLCLNNDLKQDAKPLFTCAELTAASREKIYGEGCAQAWYK